MTGNIFCHLFQKCEDSCLLYRHSACIIRGNKIVTIATNNYRNSIKNQPIYGLHAEQQVILQLLAIHNESQSLRLTKNLQWLFYGDQRKYKKYTICIMRNDYLNSKPCIHCLQLMETIGIQRVIYSYDKNIIKTKRRDIQTEHVSRGMKKCQEYLDAPKR